MKTKETKLGTALRFLSFLLYELGEALQKLGDILGDAGDLWDMAGPAIHSKARKWKARAWDAISRAGVSLACCLAAALFILCLLWNAIKRKAPVAFRWGMDHGKRARAALASLAWGVEREAVKAWAFRAEVLADAKGVA